MKVNTITVLQNLITKHRNAETYEQPEIAAEIREYALTDALADLCELTQCDPDVYRGAGDLVDVLAKRIKAGKAIASERRADTRGAEAQDAADLLSRTAVRTDYDGYALDLAYLADACHGVKALAVATEGGDAKAFDAARVAELLRVLKGQKATVAAHMVKDHVRSIEHVESVGYGRKRRTIARTEESRVQGWTLVITWTRASGSRGVMRFISNFVGTTVTMAVAHVGRPANDIAA